jgi:hypothetical protein
MLKHYSHVRMQAKRKALESLVSGDKTAPESKVEPRDKFEAPKVSPRSLVFRDSNCL